MSKKYQKVKVLNNRHWKSSLISCYNRWRSLARAKVRVDSLVCRISK